MICELSPTEARVLGVLIEKELATPDYYPMTLNALVAACNQKSNRNPVMAIDTSTVEEAVDALHYREHLASSVSAAGSRVIKYRHRALEILALDSLDLALLCELLVRGPQTVGELKGRISRLGQSVSQDVVLDTLTALSERGEGDALVKQLPREAGRRGRRWMQLLCGEEISDVPAAPLQESESPTPSPAGEAKKPLGQEVAALQETVAQLSESLAALRAEFEQFRDSREP